MAPNLDRDAIIGADVGILEHMSSAGSTRPERPETDQRCVGSLRVPADAAYLPAIEEVTRAALLVAGRSAVRTPALVGAVRHLVEELLPHVEPGRPWLLELETDDTDVYVRLWMRLAAGHDVELGAALTRELEDVTGSYDVHRQGTELLTVLQVELLG